MAKEEKAKAQQDPKAAAPKDAKAAGPKGDGKAQGGKPKGQGKEAKGEKEVRQRVPARLFELYRKEIAPAMMREFQYDNVMQVPHVVKVVVNIGVGEALSNAKALDGAVHDVQLIAGQKPIVQRAKKSIATFKLREGNAIGVKVTLRGERMY